MPPLYFVEMNFAQRIDERVALGPFVGARIHLAPPHLSLATRRSPESAAVSSIRAYAGADDALVRVFILFYFFFRCARAAFLALRWGPGKIFFRLIKPYSSPRVQHWVNFCRRLSWHLLRSAWTAECPGDLVLLVGRRLPPFCQKGKSCSICHGVFFFCLLLPSRVCSSEIRILWTAKNIEARMKCDINVLDYR